MLKQLSYQEHADEQCFFPFNAISKDAEDSDGGGLGLSNHAGSKDAEDKDRRGNGRRASGLSQAYARKCWLNG